jgi:hypothetical protein
MFTWDMVSAGGWIAEWFGERSALKSWMIVDGIGGAAGGRDKKKIAVMVGEFNAKEEENLVVENAEGRMLGGEGGIWSLVLEEVKGMS